MNINNNKTHKKPRILHCPVVALYQPYLYVKGLREIGYEADYMIHDIGNAAWLSIDSDIDLELNGTKGLHVEKTREIEFFNYAINYDIFHFHSGFGLLNSIYSLWESLEELKFLKERGKKIIMSWWGCDLRTEDVDIVYKYSTCNECLEYNKKSCKSPEKIERIKKAFKYADIHLSSGDLVASYKDVKWIDNTIDCNEWRPFKYNEIPEEFRLPKTDKIRVYHSFGNSDIRGDVKGSYEIKKAVEKLISEGHKIEFVFFDRVSNKNLKYFQAQADIVVDQLKSGWHGSTAVECLSVGKPVIVYIRPEVKDILPPDREYPLIHATIDNIYSALKDLLDHKEKIKEIGKKSRKYALKYHHYTNIAKQIEIIINDLYKTIN